MGAAFSIIEFDYWCGFSATIRYRLLSVGLGWTRRTILRLVMDCSDGGCKRVVRGADAVTGGKM